MLTPSVIDCYGNVGGSTQMRRSDSPRQPVHWDTYPQLRLPYIRAEGLRNHL